MLDTAQTPQEIRNARLQDSISDVLLKAVGVAGLSDVVEDMRLERARGEGIVTVPEANRPKALSENKDQMILGL